MSRIDPVALNRAMTLAGHTPASLARELGVTTSYVTKIAAGERRLQRNPALRRRIADTLNVPVRWIETQEVAA